MRLRIPLLLLGAALVVAPLHSVSGQDTRPARPRVVRRFTPLYDAIARRDLPRVQRLVPRAAQINDIDRVSNATPLTWTGIGANPPTDTQLDILRLLIDRGADVNIEDGGGNRPLIRAATSTWLAGVRLLLERGADPRLTHTTYRWSALYDVCNGIELSWEGKESDRLEIARALVDAGADPNETLTLGPRTITVADNCITYRQYDVARFLVSRGGTLVLNAHRASELARAPD